MTQTFGERVTAMEQKLDLLAELVTLLLQVGGFIDSEGNWIEVDVDSASPGPSES